MRASWLLIAALTVGCNKDVVDSDTDGVAVNDGPVLDHVAVTASDERAAIPITVTATDSDGVDRVSLFYRQPTQAAWDQLVLDRTGDVFTGEIPAAEVVAPQIEYYFRAQDSSDIHASSYLPDDGADAPFVVAVGVVGRALPYFQDFDAATTVYALDWDETSAGFPGYAWGIDVTKSSSGAQSAGHRRGVDGLDPLDDWLISPPLDLSTLTAIEVSWWELGDYADLADHSLWISTTGPDPLGDTFELVAELEPPVEDTWRRAPVIDLSAWAGNEAVWLAWHYEGDFTDGWWIDDVSVRELGADLHETSFGWSPDPVDPGGTTTVSLSVENRTPMASGPLTVTWEVDPAYGSFVSPVDVPAVDASGVATWTSELTVDASYPDNSYLPFTVEATDGVRTWSWEQRIVVGERSFAHVEIDHSVEGLLSVVLGVGDPAAPTFETPVTVAIEPGGQLEWDVDLTDQFALLPPAAGDLRWWLEIESVTTGTLRAFEISYDGQVAVSDDLGSWVAGDVQMFWLPRPPEPSLGKATTTPSVVAPGDTVDWAVTLSNLGAATTGVTTVQLTSSDPDVTVITGDPIALASSGGWAEGASVTLPLQVAIADTHYDSSAVQLELTVTDEVESWTLPAEIAVPWPVLRVTSVLVDDWATGDDDGLLDSGEDAYLDVDLTNLGGLDTFGSVSCTLVQTGGVASATITEAAGSFGLITAGRTKNEDDFRLSATGAIGDDLEMGLDCTDSSGMTYTSSFVLVIGEPPWLWINPVDDACGDAVGGYELDLKNGKYRADTDTLALEIESCTPFDLSTTFLEAWGAPIGADYWYYQLVVQSGTAKLRGYKGSSFTTLSTPTVTSVDDTHVLIEIDLAAVGLNSDALPIGFASGFCGGTDYYCDHMPEGWGDPYNFFYPEEFVTLSW